MFGGSTGFGAFGQQPQQKLNAFGSSSLTTSSSVPNLGALATPAQGQQPGQQLQSSQPALSFGFGNASTSATTTGFSAPSSTANKFGSFGTGTSTFSAPSFGGQGGFAAPSAFGGSSSATTFGAPTSKLNAPSSMMSGFGSAASTSAFGQPQQQMQQMQQQQQRPAVGLASIPGKVARSIEKLQHAYAPFVDANGQAVMTAVPQTAPAAPPGASSNSFLGPLSAPISSSMTPARSNEECVFKAIMYDKKVAGMLQQQQQQQQQQSQIGSGLSADLLEQAEIHNPDPSRYVPTILLGSAALKSRAEQQLRDASTQKEQLIALRDVIDSIDSSNSQMAMRFTALQMKQTQLYQKILVVLRKLEVLRCRGLPLQETEVRYRARLQHLLHSLKGPYARIQQISNMLAQQEQRADVYAEQYAEEDLQQLYAALQQQREGLESVTEILTKDMRDVAIIKAKLTEKM